jgi:hypothetical protein
MQGGASHARMAEAAGFATGLAVRRSRPDRSPMLAWAATKIVALGFQRLEDETAGANAVAAATRR